MTPTKRAQPARRPVQPVPQETSSAARRPGDPARGGRPRERLPAHPEGALRRPPPGDHRHRPGPCSTCRSRPSPCSRWVENAIKHGISHVPRRGPHRHPRPMPKTAICTWRSRTNAGAFKEMETEPSGLGMGIVRQADQEPLRRGLRPVRGLPLRGMDTRPDSAAAGGDGGMNPCPDRRRRTPRAGGVGTPACRA